MYIFMAYLCDDIFVDTLSENKITRGQVKTR